MARTDKNKRSFLSKLTGFLGTLIIIAIIIAMLPAFVPRLMGYQTFDVVSGSMEPELPVGSMVLVKGADPKEIQAGDIIAFYSSTNQGAVVTHRVVENDSTNGQFITKGDANGSNDIKPIPYDNLIGRVTSHYPVIGGILSGLTSNQGKIYLICILVAGILLNYISQRTK